MSENPKHPDHDLNQVWAAITSTRSDVAETGKQVSALTVSVQNLASEMKQLVEVVSRPIAPTNWVGIGSLIIAMLAVSGVYMQSRLAPMEKALDTITMIMRDNNAATLKDAYERGRFSADLDTNRELILDLKGRMHEQEKVVAEGCAKTEMIEKHVIAVDELGSRKWVGAN
jgi:hypothetical protein